MPQTQPQYTDVESACSGVVSDGGTITIYTPPYIRGVYGGGAPAARATGDHRRRKANVYGGPTNPFRSRYFDRLGGQYVPSDVATDRHVMAEEPAVNFERHKWAAIEQSRTEWHPQF